MSILVGSAACQARCPFCVSRQTPLQGVSNKHEPINYRNWNQACGLAKASGVNTIMLTGKGEPTLFPHQITEVLNSLLPFNFPIIELQTNGIDIADGKIDHEQLFEWYRLGLRIISVSNVGVDKGFGQRIYTPYRKEYIDLASLIENLHKNKFSVRMATVMLKGGVDSYESIPELVLFAKRYNVEQLRLCPVNHSGVIETDEAKEVSEWTRANALTEYQLKGIKDHIERNSELLLTLPHGANVYDYDGQNVCLANCLTESQNPDTIRQLIYFPDGSLRYSWQYKGARIL